MRFQSTFLKVTCKNFLFFRTISLICGIIRLVKKIFTSLKGGRLLRGGFEISINTKKPGTRFNCALSSGMMKRKLINKLMKSERKYAMCLMLAGFAALNTGFTSEVNTINTVNIAAIEEAVVAPTVDSIGVNGALAENLNTVEEIKDQPVEVAQNISELKVEAVESDINTVAIVEEQPVRENVVETSGGGMNYSAVMSMEATAYLPTDGSSAGITATGIKATYGVVAVDPRVIPLGTKVYIPGYGVALAADTGGAIKGYKIDLCMESYAECMQFGRRNVTVYILD